MEMSISLCVAEFWVDAEARNEPGSFNAGLTADQRTRTLKPRSSEDGATVHGKDLNSTWIFGSWTNSCSTNPEL